MKVSTLLPALLLTGCASFHENYQAASHVELMRLRTAHIQLFETWSEGSRGPWVREDVQAHCAKTGLEFSQLHASTDGMGRKVVHNLWQEFTDNCALSMKKQKLFSKAFKDAILPEIKQNYDYAISAK